MKNYGFRKFINDLHLWLGIGSGIIIFIICLSGTILVFKTEIEDFFTEDLVLTQQELPVKSLEEIQQNISKAGFGELQNISFNQRQGEFYEAKLKTSPDDRRGTTFLVNPHTAEIFSAPKSSAANFMFSMFKLHRWLLLDTAIGRPIVGVATIIFMLLSLSGLVLWFPKKWKRKSFRKGFKIKTKANWKRINHDLHNTLGFYSLLLIIIMGLTGLCWSFEDYREIAGNIIGTKIFNRGVEENFQPKTTLAATKDLDAIYEVAMATFPYEGKTVLGLPSKETPVYKIKKYEAAAFSPVMANELVVDQSGKILKKDLFSEKPFNVQIASLIKPLHVGDIYGTFSKILYFLVCLIATSLPVTGTMIWINKLRKKSSKKAKKKKGLVS